MSSKRKYERITTPVGVASYPWLKDADYKFDKVNGIYSCNIYVDDNEAKDFVTVIDKAYTENLAEQKKLNAGKTIKPGPKPKKKDGTLDKRRRDNKDTPGNKPSLKPSKPKK